MADYQWEKFQSKWTRQFYFRFRNLNNGKIMAQSESYHNRADRDRSLDVISNHGMPWPIVEV